MSCLSSSNFHQQASPFPANTRMHLMATSLSCHDRVGGSNQRRVTLHTTIKRGEIRKNTCTRLVLLINNVAEIKDSLIISIHIYIFFFFFNRRTSDSVRSMRELFSSVRFSEDLFSSSPSSLKTLTSSSLPRSSPPPLLLTCGIIAGRATATVFPVFVVRRLNTRGVSASSHGRKRGYAADTADAGILKFVSRCSVNSRTTRDTTQASE